MDDHFLRQAFESLRNLSRFCCHEDPIFFTMYTNSERKLELRVPPFSSQAPQAQGKGDPLQLVIDAFQSLSQRYFREDFKRLEAVTTSGHPIEVPFSGQVNLPAEATDHDTPDVISDSQSAESGIGESFSEPDSGSVAGSDLVCWHADDWRTVKWFGRTFELTKLQGEAVHKLWDAHLKGDGILSSKQLAGESGRKVSQIFRNSDLIGSLIIPVNRGRYRLATQEEILKLPDLQSG